MSRPLAVVTGASSGLGAELARCFAAGRYDLVLTARRNVELQKLAAELSAVTCYLHPADLTDPGAPGRLISELAARHLVPDVLVANAGSVVSREQLMHEVWSAEPGAPSKTLDMHVSWLRRKLGDDATQPRFITTVRGMGFRFENDD